MRLRQLVLACGLSSLVLSQYASALGLGEVTLKSALNQPLSAEIKLLDTRDLSSEQIVVALAAPADFERNGLDRLFFYTEFQFDVQLDAPDGPKVVVTSRSPVREPYLNFLVEARWTSGRLLREYTLLMDLPTFDSAAPVSAVTAPSPSAAAAEPAPTAPAAAQTPAAPVVPRPAAAQVEAPRAQPAKPAPATPAAKPAPRAAAVTANSDSYKVAARDTLWNIARDYSAGSGVSIHQAMMAIYEANPEAFIKGNINMLRRGQVLRIPAAEQMQSRSRSDAVRQFASQVNGDTGLGAQLSGSRRSASEAPVARESSGSLKLAAPGATGGGQGSGANRGTGAGLESELASTLEELDKSKAENTELSSRVRDLEAQIHTMERLVEVSNEKLRAMQLAAQQSGDASEGEAASAADVALASAPAQDAADPIAAPVAAAEETLVNEEAVGETAASEDAASSDQASSVASSAASSASAAVVASVRRPVEPSLTDKLIANAPWLGLGAAVLLGGGLFAYRRRKQKEEDEAALNELDDVDFALDGGVEEDAIPDFTSPDDSENQRDESELDIDLDAGDENVSLVDKADLHIAFGQLDQAEALLLKGLAQDPNSADARLKLLEVYSQERNLPTFDKHYAVLAGLGVGASLLARANDLRAAIPGAGDVPAPAPSALASAQEEALDLDFSDLALDESPAKTGALDLSDEGLELDLSLSDAPDAVASDALEDWDFSLDEPTAGSEESLGEFSLELDDLDKAAGAADEGLSELSLALEDLDNDISLPDASSDTSLAAFNELAAADGTTEELDVSGDDFNLDADLGALDLAALDSEIDAFDAKVEAAAPSAELGLDELSLDDVASKASEVADFAGDSLGDLDDFDGLDDLDIGDLDAGDLDVADAAELQSLDLDGLDLDDLDLNSADLDGLGATDLGSNSLASGDLGAGSLALDAGEFDAGELGSLDLSDSLDADLGSLDAQLHSPELEPEFDTGLPDEAVPASGLHLTDEMDTEFALDDESAAEPAAAAPLAAPALSDDDIFAQALAGIANESSPQAQFDVSDEDLDAELDFLAEADEAATKLDLARAYIDMGDAEGAKDILTEVLSEGSDEQRSEAQQLLSRIDA